MKKIFMMFLATLILLNLLFSTQTIAQSTDGSGKRIAIVYSTGGKGDLSFNDAAFRGIQEAKTAYPNIVIDESEPSDAAAITTTIQAFADSATNYDLIIGIGFTAADGITAAAEAHRDKQFMIVDSVVDKPNVASITFAEHEGSFLVGALAAIVSKSKKLAFLGGLDIPLINKFRAGYQQGAQYIADKLEVNITVTAAYTPDPNNPWGDVAGGKTTANTWIATGIDVMYAAAGGTGLGVMQAVNESSATDYAIGVDSDQDYLFKGDVLTSMIKKVETAVKTQIDAVVAENWTCGQQTLNLKSGGVGTSNYTYTRSVVDEAFLGTTRKAYIEDLSTAIQNGTINVSQNLEGTFPAPEPAKRCVLIELVISGVTTTVVVTSVSISVPASFAILGMLLAFLSIPTVYFVKRRK